MVEQEILNFTCFTKGIAPVRYHGVRLISMRLAVVDCIVLVDHIASHIRHWTIRHLLYAGRLQLASSVLFAFQTNWLSIYPFAKDVCWLE